MARTYYEETSSLGVCIDWFGPYKDFESFKGAIEWEGDGPKFMYFAERENGDAMYLGITESAATRFKNHQKLKMLQDEESILYWYGVINSQGKSGRRIKPGNSRKSAAVDLDQAETALINWLWPEMNEQKLEKRPDQTILIANRFFSKKKVKPRIGPEAIPRILFYDWISNRYTCLQT